MTRRLHFVRRAADPARLDAFLAERLPAADRPPSRGSLRRLVMSGAVRVEGRERRVPAWELAPGDRVDVALPAAGWPPAPRPVEFGPGQVLFRDAWLLAVDKPPGLPTHATADPSRPHLVGLVQAALGVPYLAVHQRLDRDTSGVVLFAVHRDANAALTTAFEARRVEKTYHALTVPGPVPDEWTAEHRLAPVGTGARARMAPAADGALARTAFRVRERGGSYLLVEARPHTGRKHQIRAQLAAAGAPVLGDVRYGAPSVPGVTRTLLHASRLALRHPVTGEPLVIESPLPADFAAALARLRGADADPRPRSRTRRTGRGPGRSAARAAPPARPRRGAGPPRRRGGPRR